MCLSNGDYRPIFLGAQLRGGTPQTAGAAVGAAVAGGPLPPSVLFVTVSVRLVLIYTPPTLALVVLLSTGLSTRVTALLLT